MNDISVYERWPWPRDATLNCDAVRSALASFAYGTATEAQVARVLNEGAVSPDPVVRDYARRTDVPVPWTDTASYNAFVHLATAEASVDARSLPSGLDPTKRRVQREHGWFVQDARHIAQLLAQAPWVAQDLWPDYEDSATRFTHALCNTSVTQMAQLPNLSRQQARKTRGWQSTKRLSQLPTDVIARGPLRGWWCCGWRFEEQDAAYPRMSVHDTDATVSWVPYHRTVMLYDFSVSPGFLSEDVFSDDGLSALLRLMSLARTIWVPRRQK